MNLGLSALFSSVLCKIESGYFKSQFGLAIEISYELLRQILTALRRFLAEMVDSIQTYHETVSMNETLMCALNVAALLPF